VVFLLLYLAPWLERRLRVSTASATCSTARATRPGERRWAWRSFTWVFVVFLAGASDRVFGLVWRLLRAQIWAYRVLVVVAPVSHVRDAAALSRLQESDRLGRNPQARRGRARGELPQPE